MFTWIDVEKHLGRSFCPDASDGNFCWDSLAVSGLCPSSDTLCDPCNLIYRDIPCLPATMKSRRPNGLAEQDSTFSVSLSRTLLLPWSEPMSKLNWLRKHKRMLVIEGRKLVWKCWWTEPSAASWVRLLRNKEKHNILDCRQIFRAFWWTKLNMIVGIRDEWTSHEWPKMFESPLVVKKKTRNFPKKVKFKIFSKIESYMS